MTYSTAALCTLLLGCATLGHAQAPAPFVLKGQLSKSIGPAKVYLRREGTFRGDITDSADVKNGAFQLRGTIEQPVRARLVLVQKNNRYRLLTGQADKATFYLEKGTVHFLSPDSLVHAAVTGTPLNADYQQLQTLIGPNQRQLNALYDAYRATPKEQRTPEFMKLSDEKEEAIVRIVNQQYATFIRANPGTLVSLDAVRAVGGALPVYAEVAPLFANLTPAVQNSPAGQQYARELAILKTVSVGATAPDFTLPTPDGKPLSLHDLRGQYVLLDFWASWCGPCRQENPNVVKTYAAYKGRNFTVLGVSLDGQKDRNKWLKAVADDQLAWAQVSDLKGWNSEAAVRYHVEAIPQNFLVDPNGIIVATNLRGEALSATLARVLPAAP